MSNDYTQALFASLGLELTAVQLQQFAQYQEELLCWNKKLNLTRITAEKEIIVKHFYDSALGLKMGSWTGREKVLDLGTGAGFPGIPLKILCPSLTVVLLDSLRKRVDFLDHLIKALALEQTEAVHGRAEDWGRQGGYREAFDVVVSRAVARLPVLAEYCLPFVKVGGLFLAYKGGEGEKEYQEAEQAIHKLGGVLLKSEFFVLPEGLGQRYLLSIKKMKLTPPIYPRQAGMPSKKPI